MDNPIDSRALGFLALGLTYVVLAGMNGLLNPTLGSLKSALATRVAQLGSLGFLGALGFIPGCERLFGLSGFFGLIGVAYVIEIITRFRHRTV
jgi:hypothetical protein